MTTTPPELSQTAMAGQPSPSRACRSGEAEDEPCQLAVLALVLWSVCLAAGLAGFVFPYERPRPPRPPEFPVIAQSLQVDLAPDLIPPPEFEPAPPNPQLPPPPPEAFVPPPIPEPIVVARPVPAIAFPVPVEEPARIVEFKEAPASGPVAVPAVPQPLVFGQGEGRQPAPDYPRQAERLGQEGAVVVRLTVGEDGRVRSAQAVVPCPWPLLNQSALRAVRERWRFGAGPARIYEVTIRFELVK